MPVPTQITDHATRAKARLMQQFKAATNVMAFLDIVNAQVQQYEDAVYPMLALLDIDTMVDDQLDKIGELVDEDRDGASDADYRVAIRAKIAIVNGSGTPDEIIAAFISLTGSTDTVLWEDALAGYGIWGDAASYPAGTLEAMKDASAGGVYVALMSRLVQKSGGDLITLKTGDAILLRTESTGR